MDRKFKILIVDDDLGLVSNLQDILEGEGYSSAVAKNGQTALTLCRENEFDLILIDIKLPDIPGLELIKKLAKLSPGLEYIIITGYASLESAVEAVRQRSIVAYEIKPLDMDHFLPLVREIIRRKRAEEDLQKSFKNLQETLRETNHALAAVVEVRDPYIAGHQQRVTQLVCAIAKEMGLSEEQINGLHFAATIHDLGKISIPAEILSKPGRISEIEFRMIKNHPRVGYDILKDMNFPWPIAQIILQHHERMDGSGYPQGLSGKDIVLEARILGVADVVEAMSSHRPYRQALGIDKALEEISQNKDILYDPDVVDACLKLFTEKEFKFEKN